eukprot:scaffold14870_cov119-Isochrysis_galbana.AAC.1
MLPTPLEGPTVRRSHSSIPHPHTAPLSTPLPCAPPRRARPADLSRQSSRRSVYPPLSSW